MKYLLSFAFFSLFLFSSCGDCSTPVEDDEATILAYIADNNLTAERSSEGVYYVVNVAGSEEKPNSNSQVTVAYRGYLLNGNEFDSNEEFVTQLWQVIDGWTIGIPKFGRGGSGTIFIPSSLGYDCEALVGIPANSVLAFDITLIDFQ